MRTRAKQSGGPAIARPSSARRRAVVTSGSKAKAKREARQGRQTAARARARAVAWQEFLFAARGLGSALALLSSAATYLDSAIVEDLAFANSSEALRQTRIACARVELGRAALLEGTPRVVNPLCRCGHRRSLHRLAEGVEALDECQGVDGAHRDPCICDAFRERLVGVATAPAGAATA